MEKNLEVKQLELERKERKIKDDIEKRKNYEVDRKKNTRWKCFASKPRVEKKVNIIKDDEKINDIIIDKKDGKEKKKTRSKIRTRQSVRLVNKMKDSRHKQDKNVSNLIEKKLLKDKGQKDQKRHGINKEDKKHGKKDNLYNDVKRDVVVISMKKLFKGKNKDNVEIKRDDMKKQRIDIHTKCDKEMKNNRRADMKEKEKDVENKNNNNQIKNKYQI